LTDKAFDELILELTSKLQSIDSLHALIKQLSKSEQIPEKDLTQAKQDQLLQDYLTSLTGRFIAALYKQSLSIVKLTRMKSAIDSVQKKLIKEGDENIIGWDIKISCQEKGCYGSNCVQEKETPKDCIVYFNDEVLVGFSKTVSLQMHSLMKIIDEYRKSLESTNEPEVVSERLELSKELKEIFKKPGNCNKFISYEEKLITHEYLDEEYEWIKSKQDLLSFINYCFKHDLIDPKITGQPIKKLRRRFITEIADRYNCELGTMSKPSKYSKLSPEIFNVILRLSGTEST
jgi:hypothetical protein